MDRGVTPSPFHRDFWREGIDRKFFSRVYLRAAQLGLVLTFLLMAFEQKPIGLGVACGAVVGLFSMWTVEVMVRLLFRGGGMAGLKLLFGALVKLPFLLFGLGWIAWAATKGYMNVFAVVGGILLVQGTMLVMIIAAAMAAEDSEPQWYR